MVSAPHWGCGGRRFKSCHPDMKKKLEPEKEPPPLTWGSVIGQAIFWVVYLGIGWTILIVSYVHQFPIGDLIGIGLMIPGIWYGTWRLSRYHKR